MVCGLGQWLAAVISGGGRPVGGAPERLIYPDCSMRSNSAIF